MTIDQDTGEITTEHSALIKLDTARMLLAEAKTLDEIKTVRDMAEAARLYAREHKMGLAAQNDCAEIAIRAARAAGRIIPEAFPQGGDQKSNLTRSSLIDVGISHYQSVKWQKLAEIPDDEFEEYIGETKDSDKELTTAGAIKIANHIAGQQRRASHEAQRSGTQARAILKHISWSTWLGEQPDCDLLLTDPPYMTDVDDIRAFAAEWLPAALATIKTTGRAYVCIGAYPEEIAAYLAASHGYMTLAQILIWTYRNATNRQPKYDYILNYQAILYFRGPDAPALDAPDTVEQFAVQDINAPDARRDERYHAWQKPDELAERLIRHSTKPGDLVLDPFAGTGTFVLSAARLGRDGRGCDTDQDMLTIAERRGCVIE
jgi:DNA methylase